ncbi:hypothetical protein B0H19DRAFT_1140385 [Mycena capillaripes]|nr:hypothetical protein B0H19DRAFT_1140385 [Mycena capillaripes]
MILLLLSLALLSTTLPSAQEFLHPNSIILPPHVISSISFLHILTRILVDAAWRNPALSLPTTTSNTSPSTTDLSESVAPSSSPLSSAVPPSSSTTCVPERECVLEDRIAQLEAQVQQHIAQPPPYVMPPSP